MYVRLRFHVLLLQKFGKHRQTPSTDEELDRYRGFGQRRMKSTITKRGGKHLKSAPGRTFEGTGSYSPTNRPGVSDPYLRRLRSRATYPSRCGYAAVDGEVWGAWQTMTKSRLRGEKERRLKFQRHKGQNALGAREKKKHDAAARRRPGR